MFFFSFASNLCKESLGEGGSSISHKHQSILSISHFDTVYRDYFAFFLIYLYFCFSYTLVSHMLLLYSILRNSTYSICILSSSSSSRNCLQINVPSVFLGFPILLTPSLSGFQVTGFDLPSIRVKQNLIF